MAHFAAQRIPASSLTAEQSAACDSAAIRFALRPAQEPDTLYFLSALLHPPIQQQTRLKTTVRASRGAPGLSAHTDWGYPSRMASKASQSKQDMDTYMMMEFKVMRAPRCGRCAERGRAPHVHRSAWTFGQPGAQAPIATGASYLAVVAGCRRAGPRPFAVGHHRQGLISTPTAAVVPPWGCWLQVKLCPRLDHHNWKHCPYRHPGEVAAQRRHPSLHKPAFCMNLKLVRGVWPAGCAPSCLDNFLA